VVSLLQPFEGEPSPKEGDRGFAHLRFERIFGRWIGTDRRCGGGTLSGQFLCLALVDCGCGKFVGWLAPEIHHHRQSGVQSGVCPAETTGSWRGQGLRIRQAGLGLINPPYLGRAS